MTKVVLETDETVSFTVVVEDSEGTKSYVTEDGSTTNDTEVIVTKIKRRFIGKINIEFNAFE